MTRLQREDIHAMSYRLQEIRRLEDRIDRDEARTGEIISLLVGRDLLEPSKETDDLILEFHNLNTRIELNKSNLAQMKSPSELTEEDRDRLPKHEGGNDRNNITY